MAKTIEDFGFKYEKEHSEKCAFEVGRKTDGDKYREQIVVGEDGGEIGALQVYKQTRRKIFGRYTRWSRKPKAIGIDSDLLEAINNAVFDHFSKMYNRYPEAVRSTHMAGFKEKYKEIK